jgi:anti-sigma-K factor RskA
MTEATHGEFDGLAALYALGALGDGERSRFESHLEGCLDCVREVKSLLPVTHHLPQTAVPLDPSPALRERVLREVAGWASPPSEPAAAPAPPPPPSQPAAPRKSGLGAMFWLAATLLVAGAGAGGWYAAELHRQIADLEGAVESASLRADILQLEATVADLEATRREEVIAIATDPTVQSLTLAGQPLAPRATGRALWTESARLAFVATGLPALPEGDTYQLWFVMPGANALGASLLAPETDGTASVTLDIPEAVTMPAVMAVTIEPAGGVPVPTGDVYLLGQP